MSHSAPLTSGPASNSNGVLTAPSGRAAVGGSKKKAKRRAKAAAKPEDHQHANPPYDHVNGQPADPTYAGPAYKHAPLPHDHADGQHADAMWPGPKYRHDEDYSNTQYDQAYRNHYQDPQQYSSEDEDDDDDPMAYHSRNGAPYHSHPPASHHRPQQPLPGLGKEQNKQRTMNMLESALSRMKDKDVKVSQRQGNRTKQDRIWNTSTQEERERIKEFWLSLSENERKGLLKIEKNAVLSKMKEQQKHSCSCTVCGRKRTAIEEELEVLYDAYYKELAQYANQQPGEVGEKLLAHRRSSLNYPVNAPRPLNPRHAPQAQRGRVQEVIDDPEQDDYSGEESYSDNDEIYSEDEDDYPEEEYMPNVGAGFFDFGNNLTVKDGILTVADDLLKNDGKKFIEMMEQLAERRMQREREVEYAAQRPAHSHPTEPPIDDEDDYDEDEDYDSAEEYDDDEEESDMGGLTDEQRMEEGRRMFQIFAARMFEQRVLTAYREKVAAERQAKLLEELEEEDKAKSQKDAKRAKEAERKKNKKQAQKQAKAEERAKKDAEKAAEEAAAKAAEEQRLDEQRKRKEEQRKKKEAEKKAADEERLRKDAERLRRQQEERDRKVEEERKLREAKAQEKKLKDDQRKKERDEREAREKEAREQKAHDDKMRKEQEAKEKPVKAPTAQQPPQIIKRPSTVGQVAVPPALAQKSSLPSPHVPVATPAIPKAPTPGIRTRQSSAQESSSGTSPRNNVPVGPKAKSPTGPERAAPKHILQNPHKQPQQQQQPQPQQMATPAPHRPSVSLPHPTSHQGPPPGVHPPYQGGFSMGFPTFNGQHGPLQQRPSVQTGPHHAQTPNFRQPLSGMTMPPGGFATQMGRGFTGDVPPGFPSQLNHLPGGSPVGPAPRPPVQSHSRQQSDTDNDMSPPPHVQPIGRPAPIQRPSSVKTGGETDVDGLSKHLGSRALLDDADDMLPSATDRRMASNPIGVQRGGGMGFASPHFGAPHSAFANPTSNWSNPTTFGPPSGLATTPSWGAPAPPPLGPNTWTTATPFGNPLGAPGAGPVGRSGNHPPRSRALRLAVCSACRTLSNGGVGPEYHDVGLVIAQIAAQHGLPDGSPQPSLQEIEDICETEGDALNGGGQLHCRRSGPRLAVKFDPIDHGSGSLTGAGGGMGGASGLGEIGSPVPGAAAPGFGGLRGFGGLASPGGF